MSRNEQQYLDLCRRILDEGQRKDDRTGTGTLSVFGAQIRFDLQAGFPLLTTKRMPLRIIFEELRWFLRGDTDIKYLLDQNVHIWNADAYRDYKERGGSLDYGDFIEMAREDGYDMGPIYGKQFRGIEHSYWVTPKVYEPSNTSLSTTFDKDITVDYSGDSKFIGNVIETESGKCTVIKEIKNDTGRSCFVVKFHETGYEKIVKYSRVQNGQIKDPYKQSVFGVGRYGEYVDDEYTEMLVETWREMLRRCYYDESKAYKSYGSKGVHVDTEWLTFANFNEDVRKVPNWYCKVEYPSDYSLDKDVLSASNRYSKETCMWSSHQEQSYNTSTNKPFIAKSPDGRITLFKSVGQANREQGLNKSAVHRCLNGDLKTHKGWSEFSYVTEQGKVLRTRVIDQVKELIANIKHNPDSRRLIISLYNPHELGEMALPPCHGNVIQFYVRNGKYLDCQMYQRSSDTFLGNPFNIASYALLTHMIADICGLYPGEFIHTIGDAHIYMNHVEQMREQITREPRKLPTLLLSPDKQPEDPAQYTWDDVDLVGYDPHPPIKGKVSVG